MGSFAGKPGNTKVSDVAISLEGKLGLALATPDRTRLLRRVASRMFAQIYPLARLKAATRNSKKVFPEPQPEPSIETAA
jgi:hypothetical protein